MDNSVISKVVKGYKASVSNETRVVKKDLNLTLKVTNNGLMLSVADPDAKIIYLFPLSDAVDLYDELEKRADFLAKNSQPIVESN